jgi:adenine-specific DNA-methyltransferase
MRRAETTSMSKSSQRQTEPVARESVNLVAERIGQLKALFPDAVSEGKVDFDRLRAALGDGAAAGAERFSFGWAGRADAVALLQTPSRATLVPSPEESVAFDTTKNLFVEGDNLEVLKLLYKAYAGKVKLIYIDPPYNTGQDFIYPDNFADPLAAYLQMTGQQDAAGNLLTSNPETSGRYHSAWLSMMFPRLFLARQLLRACLDDTLNPDIAKALALTADDLFVCRDRALDDTLAANLALQCRLKTI